MEFRRLGESGLEVSVLCLGTMMFGDRTDAAAARRIIGSAFDAGVNFIDTADVYAKGASESIVGPAIASNRRRWILATKVGNVMTQAPHDGGLSRRWIVQACDDSLQRLATDYIDIYYLHRDDVGTPLAETVEAIGELLRAGKIRYFGVSNYRGWRIAEIVALCADLGVPQPVVCQPYYNAMNRMPEVEILPACDYYGIGVVPYSPLARGVLTGKYAPGADAPAESRAGRKDRRMMETEFRAESLAMAQTIKTHAANKGLSAAQFALAWVLANRIVSSIVCGPRTIEQWNDYLTAISKTLDGDDEALVDSLVTPGHPSTPGYNDPQYPFYGRIVGG
ncbi:MAG TPA: aldo/keto reductase [Casimicrobiaceae bacterium]|nr:aldo/keto reductase [Casimicrobiaceae bacterium]